MNFDLAEFLHGWLGRPALQDRAAVLRYAAAGEAHTLRLQQPGHPAAAHGLEALWRWQPDGDGCRMWLELANRGAGVLHLQSMDVLNLSLTPPATPPRWSIYQNGWASWTPALARQPAQSLYTDPGTIPYRAMHQPHAEAQRDDLICSEWVTVLARLEDPSGSGFLLGFVTAAGQLAQIRVRADGTALAARCYLDNLLLAPGASLRSETLLLQVGAPPLALLEAWAERLGQEMGARRPQHPPSGWCSWYYFYGENTAADVLDNVAAMQRHDLPLDVVLVDDGYQTAIGDWFSLDVEKFPDGMEPVARAVRQHGRQLGIWTAPFAAAADVRLTAEHPDWFLEDEEGRPVLGWTHWGMDCYALDCTHPEVLDWLEETFRRMRREWGVDFFKIDFIFSAARPGRRFDPTATRAQALRRGVSAIRRGIGDDAFLLGCGAPLAPCTGLVDGMRVGPDVDPNWHPLWRHDLSMPAVENALRNAIVRAPFHGRLWANDPDCLLVRQRGHALDLVLNEMRTLAAVAALLGGLTLDSDHLPEIRPGRLKYLRQALPPTGLSARPLDLFENELPGRLLLSFERDWGRWWVAGLINWKDHTVRTTVRLDELGLPAGFYHVYHYWRRRYLGVSDETVTLRRHQPHETAVLLFKPVSPRPDLLTSTFHVCQGAVEVCAVRWQAVDEDGGGLLTVRLEKPGRQFGRLLFSLPQGWQAADAWADGARRPLVCAAPGVVSLGLTLEGNAEVQVAFRAPRDAAAGTE